jgi:hypothetical protein
VIHGRLEALSLALTLLACTAGCGFIGPYHPDPPCLGQWGGCPGTPERKRQGSTLASVAILAWSDSVEVGQVVVLNFELRPRPGESLPLWAYSVTVSWASSDTSVATVEHGDVLGKRVGVATISATAKGVVGTRRITVTPVKR